MATATSTTERVPVTTFREETQVTLTLTQAEAEVLLFVTEQIAGSPSTNAPRGLMDSIGVALKGADVRFSTFPTKASQIYFV